MFEESAMKNVKQTQESAVNEISSIQNTTNVEQNINQLTIEFQEINLSTKKYKKYTSNQIERFFLVMLRKL